MTLGEVVVLLDRINVLSGAIEDAKSTEEVYRTQAEGLSSPQYGNGSGPKKHDGFETKMIRYIEKMQKVQEKRLDLSIERAELEMKLLDELRETTDRKVIRMIERHFDARKD